jgi:hypothetical protein
MNTHRRVIFFPNERYSFPYVNATYSGRALMEPMPEIKDVQSWAEGDLVSIVLYGLANW